MLEELKKKKSPFQSGAGLAWELHWSKSMIVSDLKTVPIVYYIAYVNGEISQLNHY